MNAWVHMCPHVHVYGSWVLQHFGRMFKVKTLCWVLGPTHQLGNTWWQVTKYQLGTKIGEPWEQWACTRVSIFSLAWFRIAGA